MPLLIRTWHLANGLKVEIFDHAVSYYADNSTIKLVICCDVEVKKEYLRPFETHPHYEKIMETLGDVAAYRREIVKAGVPAKHLPAMKRFLVERFEENALAYFEREDFPARYVCKRFGEIAGDLAKKDRFQDGG
jgi:hypothetical protein